LVTIMWTDETKISDLIFLTVKEPVAQRLLYQAQLHVESFQHNSEQLHESFETLLFEDFARTQSCHMTEGIFGADIHAAKMESAKVRVWGFLSATVAAAYKCLRCIANARQKDRGRDWAILRQSLDVLPDQYRRTRNFLEHMDEAVYRGEVTTLADCRFSRHGELEFRDEKGNESFLFTKEALGRVLETWKMTIHILRNERNWHETSGRRGWRPTPSLKRTAEAF
jgi:hypothetical protein